MRFLLPHRHFNPRPPRGGRQQGMRRLQLVKNDFNPRPPRGGRRRGGQDGLCRRHFNPRPPRGGRLNGLVPYVGPAMISIHAPREGGDPSVAKIASIWRISIHAPREGGDFIWVDFLAAGFEFQSTPPARGATKLPVVARRVVTYFNPRPPRGGRQSGKIEKTHFIMDFNPRPPRGGRPLLCSPAPAHNHFNPRPPRGGRLRFARSSVHPSSISIHAPREGGDPGNTYAIQLFLEFQSTPPARGATAKMHSFTCGSLTNK